VNGRIRLFLSQAVLLMAVTTALASAEHVWSYWAVAAVSVLAGGWRVWRGGPALLGSRVSQVAIVAAFLLLLCDWFWLSTIGVMALAHFMIAVCAVLLLTQQKTSEQGMVFVLLFVLLMVASLISGHFLFGLVLLIYVVVGLPALVRLHLVIEKQRTRRENHRLFGRPWVESYGSGAWGGAPVGRVSVLAGLTSLLVGMLVFIAVPRVGGGVLGRLEGHVAAVSGSDRQSVMDFRRIGPIRTSQQKVFRAQVASEDGRILGPEEVAPYFRSVVFDQYRQRPGPGGGHWEWRSVSREINMPGHTLLTTSEDLGGIIPVLPVAYGVSDVELVTQRYWLEPDLHRYLFALYPPREVSSRDFNRVRRFTDDLTLGIYLPAPRSLRYEVVSIQSVCENLAAVMASWYGQGRRPELLLPDPPLPREAEIRALVAEIDARAGTQGTLDDPVESEQFVVAAQAFLQAPRFRYSLNPPPVGGGDEPIGDFLFGHHQGHCEYFAAALVLLCQYRGIPARIATGFLGRDYNEVGGYYNVTEENAHAWAEVYLPGRDWVRFDPTPASASPDASYRPWLLRVYRYLDYLQFQWSDLVVDYDASSRHALFAAIVDWLQRPAGARSTAWGAVLGFVSELIWWRSELGWRDRVLYWLFAIMVLTMVVLLAYVAAVVTYRLAVRLRRWCARRWAARLSGESAFYARMCRRMAELGVAPQPGQTPAEFAGELACRFPILRPAPELVAAYYAARFGRHVLPAPQRDRMESFLKQLAALSRVQLSAVKQEDSPRSAR